MRAASLAILLAALLLPAAAQAQSCPDLPRSVLQFYRPTADQVIEHIASPAEVEERSSASEQPSSHRLMAMAYTLDTQLRVNHHVVLSPAGYCDAPELVILSFGIVRRDLYMVPEAAAVPCIRQALLTHESEHARVIDRAAHDFIEQHRAALLRMVEAAKHRAAADEDAAKAGFAADLYRLLGSITVDFGGRVRGPLRDAVDNPSELARLDAACHGALGAMASAVRLPGVGL